MKMCSIASLFMMAYISAFWIMIVYTLEDVFSGKMLASMFRFNRGCVQMYFFKSTKDKRAEICA